MLFASACNVSHTETSMKLTYEDLLTLFADWREFESPPMLDGAPDYTVEQFAARQSDYDTLRARLE